MIPPKNRPLKTPPEPLHRADKRKPRHDGRGADEI
nr:MAG TPA: hypothetical protein [Caudoviricetes sp.]